MENETVRYEVHCLSGTCEAIECGTLDQAIEDAQQLADDMDEMTFIRVITEKDERYFKPHHKEERQ